MTMWDRPRTGAAEGEFVPLENVFLHVTRACNLHCRYCYFSARAPLPDEMTAEEFGPLWRDLAALRPKKVVFTGGEPLLRPDLLDLLRGLGGADPGHHVLRCLNSNGHGVTPAFARRLVGLVDEVRVSLDALRDRNDALRGPGNFDAALGALECYYAAGFEPKVLVTLTSVSLPDLDALLALLSERKITRVNVNPFRRLGRGSGHDEWVVEPGDLRDALCRVRQSSRPEKRPAAGSAGPAGPTHCGAGRFLNILPDGDVFPCHVLTDPEFRCGNVREQGLLEICRREGLLGRLQALDVADAAGADPQLAALARTTTCLGDLYAGTKALPVWRTSLPVLGHASCGCK
jgi:MoaA/NifB/PqqE/SkfB family radical SAM enzyme